MGASRNAEWREAFAQQALLNSHWGDHFASVHFDQMGDNRPVPQIRTIEPAIT